MLTQEIEKYIEDHAREARELLVELAQIPAPSHQEEKRAAFCLDWLRRHGAAEAYVDDVLNVVCPVGVEDGNDLMVFMAHSDVVFPDTEPLPLYLEDDRICCPGVGDDTACVVALMMAAAYITSHRRKPKDCGVLLVINSGEEGLGNLKGCRRIMERYGHRVREFITFDGQECRGVDRAVGSRRYDIRVETEGGHSYGAFGNRNAIACLASLIGVLYQVTLPPRGKTTYNVGTISGGTSVNTIAQNARMLYEFRSDEGESLAYMEAFMWDTVEKFRAGGIDITVTEVGSRPCSGDVDRTAMQRMRRRADEATGRWYGTSIVFGSGSTDCNVPLSMGIPSICVGCYRGGGSHTRQEWVEISSLLPGLKFTFDMILHHFEA